MSEFVDVEEFFSSVYLVDFSPSLCEVARKRFIRLGWKNVKVVCQDARTFRLEDHESSTGPPIEFPRAQNANYYGDKESPVGGAHLITLSYSLSMIVSACSVYSFRANKSSLTFILSLIHYPLFLHLLVQLGL